jgi:hypothetical protein
MARDARGRKGCGRFAGLGGSYTTYIYILVALPGSCCQHSMLRWVQYRLVQRRGVSMPVLLIVSAVPCLFAKLQVLLFCHVIMLCQDKPEMSICICYKARRERASGSGAPGRGLLGAAHAWRGAPSSAGTDLGHRHLHVPSAWCTWPTLVLHRPVDPNHHAGCETWNWAAPRNPFCQDAMQLQVTLSQIWMFYRATQGASPHKPC